MGQRTNDQGAQITLEVTEHPKLRERRLAELTVPLEASIKIKGRFGIAQNLQHGDQVSVTIASADGTVIAQGVCEVGIPAFAPLLVKGDLIGLERVHTAVH